CGVLRFSSLAELCEAAQAFATQKVPAGNRVGMVTNAGSPAIIVTDEAIKAGLRVPELSPSSRELLATKLQSIASIANPIDMMATASGEEFGASLQALVDDPGLDAAVVCFMTPFFVDTLGIARAIEEQARRTDKTLIAVAMTNPDEQPEWRETVERVRQAGVPVYYFPEAAARVLFHMDRYRRLRDRPRAGRAPDGRAATWPGKAPGPDRSAAAALLRRVSPGPGGFLAPADVRALFSCYGISLVREELAGSWEEVRAAAGRLGWPVVLKAYSPRLVHKTEAGGVFLDLRDEAALCAAFLNISGKLSGAAGLRYLVQPQIAGGVEVIIGGTAAPGLGALVMFGLGGIHVELLGDVVFRLGPLDETEAGEMLDSIAGAPLLTGFRGRPPIDRQPLVELLQRVSWLLHDHPAIAELDLNPVICSTEGQGVFLVDARVRVA
ncbi:MAG: acetate--CoA ligase family protein, partial [Deltaproteobacteria bacterium]|nr:acetate--CoA ligase family protein [Deltaproteobacteria bacterium]